MALRLVNWWKARPPALKAVVHPGLVLLLAWRLVPWWQGRGSLARTLLLLATTMLSVELTLRPFPGSTVYRRWTAVVHAVGTVWTAVVLSFIYLLAVGPVTLGMWLARRDLLDRRLLPEPSFWRTHEPNPLGPDAAARHQF